MSISATWLALMVIALRFLLKKAPKWVNVFLWGLVAVRLVCPFTLESALSLIPSAETISPEIMMDVTPEIHTGIEAVNSVVNPVITETFAPEPAASANPLQILIPAASVLWCVGMGLMGLYTLVTYWRLRHKVRMAIRVNDDIYLSEYVASPFVLGIGRPRIYLPYHMDDLDRYHVIAHERTHIRRKDHWWKPLGFLLLTIHWFNPVMWVAYVLLCRDIELACDEKVVRNMREDQRANYSQALLNCSIDRKSIAACPIAFGEVGVKERVRNVLNYKKPGFWVILIALILCTAVAVCFLTDPETPAELENLMGKTYEVTEMAYSDPRYSFTYHPGLNTPSYAISETGHLLSKNDINFDTWTDLGQLEVTELTKENFDDYIVVDEDFRDGTAPSTFRRKNVQAWQVTHEESFGSILYYLLRQENGDVYLAYGRFDPDIQLIRWLMKLEVNSQDEWGVAMSVEDVSPTGLTAVFDYTNPILTGELTYGEDYHLQRLSNGEWVDVEMLAEENAVITIAYAVPPNSTSRHSVNWSSIYGELPSGTYRIGKSVSLSTAPGTYENRVLYAEFSLGDSLSWLQTLATENVEKVEYLAFLADPSAQYTLYEGDELGEVLEVLRSFNGTFVEEASVETIYGGGYELTVTLKDGTVHTVHNIGNVYLCIDGEYYEDTYSLLNQTWDSCFQGTTYAPAEGLTGSGWKSLEYLPENYSLEQAEIDGCLIMVDGDVRSNQQAWFDFVDSGNFIRFVTYYSGSENEPSQMFVHDLSYDGETYTLRTIQDGQEYVKNYQYLRSFSGQPESPNASYDAYERWVLTDNKSAIYEELWESLLSSQSDVAIDYFEVYSDLIYFPDHPAIPEVLTEAALVQDGESLLTLRDFDALEDLRTLLANAEFLGYYPKTPDFGPELRLTDASGGVTSLYLSMDSDLFELDGNCFDYGPGYDGYGSNNDQELLWQILGLTEWTVPNLTKWPLEICSAYESYRESVAWAEEHPLMNRMFIPLSPDWETDTFTITLDDGTRPEITEAERDAIWEALSYAPLDKYYGPALDLSASYVINFTYKAWNMSCRVYPLDNDQFYITRTIDSITYTCTDEALAEIVEAAIR